MYHILKFASRSFYALFSETGHCRCQLRRPSAHVCMRHQSLHDTTKKSLKKCSDCKAASAFRTEMEENLICCAHRQTVLRIMPLPTRYDGKYVYLDAITSSSAVHTCRYILYPLKNISFRKILWVLSICRGRDFDCLCKVSQSFVWCRSLVK